MMDVFKFLKRFRPAQKSQPECHRCQSPLQGKRGARYCSNCLWDELEDPTQDFIQVKNENGTSSWMDQSAYADLLITEAKLKTLLYSKGFQ